MIGNGSCGKGHSCEELVGEYSRCVITNLSSLFDIIISHHMHTLFEITGSYTSIGNHACNGEYSCSTSSSPNMTIHDYACDETRACARASGKH